MKRPNILLFFTDQQRFDCSGLHGNPLDLMPDFDAFARQNTHLSQFFTPQPVCGPARSCLQSGQYATQTGCWKNGIPLPENVPTLAKSFGASGYKTGYIGKWHLGSGEGAVAPAQRGGYDFWLASNLLELTSDAYETRLYDDQNQEVFLPGYRADALTDAAIRFVHDQQTQHPDQPFFLTLSFLEPHHQNHRDDHPAPTGYAAKYSGRWMPPDLQALGGYAAPSLGGYFGMVKRLDECFGRVLDALRSLEIQEDTIVVFLSDHGCHFKTRNAEYKRSCHDASIRVPGAIGGGPFRGGGHLEALVSLLDIPPTLCDAAGVEIPATFAGRSLLPLVERKSSEWPEEVFVQISESQVGRCVRSRRWKYGVVAPGGDGWQDAGAPEYQETFLYDLFADPYELSNLAGFASHAEVAARMRTRLLERMAQAGEETPVILPAPPTTSGQQRLARPARLSNREFS